VQSIVIALLLVNVVWELHSTIRVKSLWIFFSQVSNFIMQSTKKRYESLSEKYQELKKSVQPYLDAVKLAPERVRAFLVAVLTHTSQARQHEQPARRRGQDMEL